jgi:hypothetical protein
VYPASLSMIILALYPDFVSSSALFHDSSFPNTFS